MKALRNSVSASRTFIQAISFVATVFADILFGKGRPARFTKTIFYPYRDFEIVKDHWRHDSTIKYEAGLVGILGIVCLITAFFGFRSGPEWRWLAGGIPFSLYIAIGYMHYRICRSASRLIFT